MKAKLTNNRNAKPGDIAIVPLGMIFPHAIKLTRVWKSDEGHKVGDGVTVEHPGCSNYGIDRNVSVYL